MLIVPAIDMLNGECIRLYKGDYKQVTVYGDPVEIALKWQSIGAKLLHLVDLDGAEAGNPKNLEVVKKLVEVLDIPVELGGGIRSMETIRMYLDLGVSRVILGTAAVENKALVACAAAVYGEKIVVGIDAVGGMVKTKGWLEDTKLSAVDLAHEMRELGISRIIYTDIDRDGTLAGPNLQETENIARESNLRITASGGMSSLKDVKNVLKLEQYGVDEVILGKSIYEGKIDLSEALRLVEGE
ncbi:MAG: 1-(5-phosphoribosyl)-5-[(5-phosphoribosylamino)methylideneamino]imidazole-4-carboxamide isomerase [Fusobacteria bacterium]|nr:1-(5-phosphoribosyl)-5-[(5-phosphoribosylamino)methylideneamino]imidazole-4-carboxamide isomerase [Fusobacteriota bacterium]